MIIKVTRGQIPVGQGCFSYGRVQSGASHSFLYVHDCGGRQDLVKKGVTKYLGPLEEIDALYISHFDDDHVSGLEYLLFGRKVRHAFVPALDLNAKLHLLTLAFANGVITPGLQQFIWDTSAWLIERGVVLVHELNPLSDDQRPLEPEIVDINPESVGNQPRTISSPMIHIAISGHVIWQLKSFSVVEQDHDFLSKLNRYFKLTLPDEEAARNWLISDAVTMKQIKDFFQQEYLPDHNCVSLCLFSGPALILMQAKSWYSRGYQGSHHRRFFFNVHCSHRYHHNHGWIHTADYPFRLKEYLTRFLNYYDDEMNSIGVFMLSHHGSDKDFKEEIFDAAKNATIAVIPVGSKKQHGHPSDRALTVLLLRRIIPVMVMDDPDDIFLFTSSYYYPYP